MLHHLKNQRGSIEIVILVAVFALAIGIVAWRIAESQNAQTDAERSAAVADNAPDVSSKYVTVKELGFKFLNPTEAGTLSYEINQKEGKQYARVFSSKLKTAKYLCQGENKGEVGTVHVMNKSETIPGPAPDQQKELGDKKYLFYSSLLNKCYEDSLQNYFRDPLPKTLTESIKEEAKQTNP